MCAYEYNSSPLTSWYNYVSRTDKARVGTCVLTIELVDGTEHLANFRVR